MPTIDLSTAPPPEPAGLLDALPRRMALTLPELRLVAQHAGGAPLPFDLAGAADSTSLEGRLGPDSHNAEDQAYTAALASLHDPEATLQRRGLLDADGVDAGLIGAVGLLAKPSVALDLDVAAGGVHAKAWHRLDGDAVATLATADGIVFELAWFPTAQWTGELARVAVVPEDVTVHESTVPPVVDVPYEFVDASSEAVRSGRHDVAAVLVSRHADSAVDEHGRPLPDSEVAALLTALTTETRGRLRAMVADVSGERTTVVGVVSWVLLSDGWRALRPHRTEHGHRVEIRLVEPVDLGPALAPVLAEVTS
jgi:hypothetical protein